MRTFKLLGFATLAYFGILGVACVLSYAGVETIPKILAGFAVLPIVIAFYLKIFDDRR